MDVSLVDVSYVMTYLCLPFSDIATTKNKQIDTVRLWVLLAIYNVPIIVYLTVANNFSLASNQTQRSICEINNVLEWYKRDKSTVITYKYAG